MTVSEWVISVFVAYLLGSIPFGLLIAKVKGVNIREHGSKNIGATNVARVLGKPFGLLCFFLDVLKGFAPVCIIGSIAGLFGESIDSYDIKNLVFWITVAISTVLGHTYSVFLKFGGGKGVATTLGSVLAMWPPLTIPIVASFLCFIFFLIFYRIVSIGSIMASILLPLATYYQLVLVEGYAVRKIWPLILMTTLITTIVLWKHRSNISRIVKGAEPKINTHD